MAVPKANQRAVNKYVKANYDRINVTMPKGEKEIIQGCAAAQGESVNGFIVRALRGLYPASPAASVALPLSRYASQKARFLCFTVSPLPLSSPHNKRPSLLKQDGQLSLKNRP